MGSGRIFLKIHWISLCICQGFHSYSSSISESAALATFLFLVANSPIPGCPLLVASWSRLFAWYSHTRTFLVCHMFYFWTGIHWNIHLGHHSSPIPLILPNHFKLLFSFLSNTVPSASIPPLILILFLFSVFINHTLKL